MTAGNEDPVEVTTSALLEGTDKNPCKIAPSLSV